MTGSKPVLTKPPGRYAGAVGTARLVRRRVAEHHQASGAVGEGRAGEPSRRTQTVSATRQRRAGWLCPSLSPSRFVPPPFCGRRRGFCTSFGGALSVVDPAAALLHNGAMKLKPDSVKYCLMVDRGLYEAIRELAHA